MKISALHEEYVLIAALALSLGCGGVPQGSPPSPIPLTQNAPAPPVERWKAGVEEKLAREELTQARAEAASLVLRTAADELWHGNVGVDATWHDLTPIGQQGIAGTGSGTGTGAIAVRFRRQSTNTHFATYYITPWQSMRDLSPPPNSIRPALPLAMVSPDALVFGPVEGDDTSPDAERLRLELMTLVNKELSLRNTQGPPPKTVKVPKNLRVMSMQIHSGYVEIQAALPGSSVEMSQLDSIAPGRMLKLTLVPDQGQVTSHWIAPAMLPGTKDEDLTEAYTAARDRVSELKSRLAYAGESAVSPLQKFSNYSAKQSPDSVTDLRPTLSRQLKSLPQARKGHCAELLRALKVAVANAVRKPGAFKPGNQILGADSNQYVPSDEELIASELGARATKLINRYSPKDLENELKAAGIHDDSAKFFAIKIRHVDVMGSGRFFYASVPEPVTLSLKRK